MKTYRFVDGTYEIRNEIKHSIFIATVKGEVDRDSAEEFVKSIKKKYADATHNCYAYISDENGNATRFSDDGEPSGTAGQPILDVIRKQNLVKTAIVVTRYFGGIKLGAGGLVGAYSGAASDVVNASTISQKIECGGVDIASDYATFAPIEKYLRRANIHIDNIEYGNDVRCTVFVPTDDVDALIATLTELSSGRAQISKNAVYQFKKM